MFKKINEDLSNINNIEDKIKYLESILKKLKDKNIIKEVKNLIKQFKSQLEESEIERKINQQKIEPLQEQDFISTPFPEVEVETPARIRRTAREIPVREVTEPEEETELQYTPTLTYTPTLESTSATGGASLYSTSPILYESDLTSTNLREEDLRAIRESGLDIDHLSAEQRALFREHVQRFKVDAVGDHLDKYLNTERNPLAITEYKPLKSTSDVRTSGFIERDIKEREGEIKYIKKIRGGS